VPPFDLMTELWHTNCTYLRLELKIVLCQPTSCGRCHMLEPSRKTVCWPVRKHYMETIAALFCKVTTRGVCSPLYANGRMLLPATLLPLRWCPSAAGNRLVLFSTSRAERIKYSLVAYTPSKHLLAVHLLLQMLQLLPSGTASAR